MGNSRVIMSRLAYTPTADSADANFPVTNLNIITNLLRAWNAFVDTGIVNVTLDFGVGNTLSDLAANPGLLIDDCNVTSMRIQGNSVTNNWVTPPWDQPITIAQHSDVQRYKDFRRLLDLSASAFAYRYLNLRIPSQTTTDGLTYRIGRVMLGQIRELAVNASATIDRTLQQEIIETKFIGGGGETNVMGEPSMLFHFPHKLPSSTALADLRAIAAVGIGIPFVLWDSAMGGNTQDGWLVKRTAPAKFSQVYDSYFTTDLELQEVI